MEPTRGYKPFLIGEGRQTTGYFTYLDSWIKPQTAYDVLDNCYIYRGSLFQRNGFTLFPSTTGAGAILYQNNEIIATGAGTNTRSGTLANFPLLAQSITITARTSAGLETWTDVANNGILVGTLGDTGTINYTTGAWAITLGGLRTIAASVPVVGQYSFLPTTAGIGRPIMAIKQFINETLDTNVLVICDTDRLSWWDSATTKFQPVSQFQQYFYQFPDPNTFTATNNGTNILLQWKNLAPYSLTVKTFTKAGVLIDTVNDVPTNSTTGVFTSSGAIDGAASTINYSTGSIKIVFTGAPTAQTFVQITGNLQGDYFTGNNTNFFNATNWDAPDQPSFLYLTNNVDPITLFNGTTLSRPAFALYKASVTKLEPSQVLLPFRNDIATCLDVQVFQDRLLVIRPTIYTDDLHGHTLKATAENQAIYYTGINSPLNLSFSPQNLVLPTEIAGNGGFAEASTGDILQSEELIRDVIVVFFTNSTWIMRSTGSPIEPFRFYRLNVSRTTNAPYGSIAYDVTASSMGARGLIMSDGVGVDRYDESVIDLFEEINNNAFGQCFAQRYDAENQSWMLYPSDATSSLTSDKIIVYNFLEETWAKYTPNLGVLASDATKKNTLSCLGLGYTTKDITWDDLAAGTVLGGVNGMTWDQANFPWDNFLEQDLTPSLLAGDQNGYVFIADDGPFDQVGPQNSQPNGIHSVAKTKRLNPFIEGGQKATFGYLDVYYQVNNGGQMRINIYGNNSNVVYKSFLFTLDGSSSAGYNWKRFYMNITAEFIQIEFNSYIDDDINNVPVYNPAPPFKILGMILWADAAGRLTPGRFL